MKLEQPFLLNTVKTQKGQLSCGNNFKEKLPNYLKEINLNAPPMPNQEQPKKEPNQVQKQFNLGCQKNKLSSQISTLLQTTLKIYYFLGRNTSIENYSEIIIYQYLKQDGKHESMELNGIKGVIMAMKAKFCPRRRLSSQNNNQSLKLTKDNNPNKQQNHYEVVLLLGTKSGYLKTIRFNDIESSDIQNRSSIQNLKLDHSPLIDIAVLDPKHYSNANVCLVLSMTNHVFLVNFDYMNLLAMFVPSIVNCEIGLSLAVNHQRHYFVQASEGGYIVFWQLDENLQKIIQLSNVSSENQDNLGGKYLSAKTEDDEIDKTIKTPLFKLSQIHHCITPISIFHSSTITGLKHCQLYGNLLLIITQGGIIKILALNKSSHSHINENEFCTLLEYQVQDGELISDVKFLPLTREIFMVKNSGFEGVMEKSGDERFIHVKEYAADKASKKNKAGAPNSISFPYKPICFKQIKSSLQVQQRPRSKSMGNAFSRCYFERIIFNSELQIERVDKIKSSIPMQGIDSIEIVNQMDVFFLRGKDFYLVGIDEKGLLRTINLV